MASIELTWPKNLGDQKQGQPNYILFTAKKRVLGQREDILGSVALPIPIGALSASYKANYENAALGFAAGVAMQTLQNDVGASFTGKNLESLTNQTDVNATALAKDALSSVGSQTALAKFRNNVLGTVKNPYQFVTYTGPEFRSFSMNWTLIPTDSSEAGTIHRIAKFFKKFTLPNKRGLAGSSYFEMPPTFDVEMKIHAQGDSNAIDLSTKGKDSGRVHRFARMVLTSTEVDYNGIGALVPTFFNDGYPTGTKLTIGLQETELITADMVDKGY